MTFVWFYLFWKDKNWIFFFCIANSLKTKVYILGVGNFPLSVSNITEAILVSCLRINSIISYL